MDKLKLTTYQTILLAYLQECLAYVTNPSAVTTWQPIIDKQERNFLLLSFGWQKEHYNYFLAFHLEIREEKVWIHRNNTEWQIASELVEKGIAKQDIVLGFLPSNLRETTQYAAFS
jgi:hypothetical protein